MANHSYGAKGAARNFRQPVLTLTIRRGPESGRSFLINRQTFTLGSAPGNDVVAPFPDVARYHAVMVREETHWVIYDLESSGGVFVNDQRIGKKHPVLEGDRVGLGPGVAFDISQTGLVSASQKPVSGAASGAPKRSPGWFLIALAVLMGLTGVFALLVLIMLNSPGAASEAVSDLSDLNTISPAETTAPPTTLPEMIPIQSPTVLPAPATVSTFSPPPISSPTPCLDDAVFVEDITLPDGSSVVAGDRFDKSWRIRNVGTCPWREGYRFKFVSGDDMGIVDSVVVAYTDPGEVTDIAVPMFAPVTAGEYSGSWQMTNVSGESFGQPVSVSVLVKAAAATATVVTEFSSPEDGTTSAPVIRFWAEDETLPAGEKTTLHVQTENVAAVWLDGDIVLGGQTSREVSPCSTTNYTLDVQLRDGKHVYQNVKINVTGVCPGQNHADLSIQYNIVPAQVVVGQPVVISYTVFNKGTAGADDFDVVFSPGTIESRRMRINSGLSLSPGYGLMSTYSYTWPISGVFQTNLLIDSNNLIEELDEQNNAMNRVIVVGEN